MDDAGWSLHLAILGKTCEIHFPCSAEENRTFLGYTFAVTEPNGSAS